MPKKSTDEKLKLHEAAAAAKEAKKASNYRDGRIQEELEK